MGNLIYHLGHSMSIKPEQFLIIYSFLVEKIKTEYDEETALKSILDKIENLEIGLKSCSEQYHKGIDEEIDKLSNYLIYKEDIINYLESIIDFLHWAEEINPNSEFYHEFAFSFTFLMLGIYDLDQFKEGLKHFVEEKILSIRDLANFNKLTLSFNNIREVRFEFDCPQFSQKLVEILSKTSYEGVSLDDCTSVEELFERTKDNLAQHAPNLEELLKLKRTLIKKEENSSDVEDALYDLMAGENQVIEVEIIKDSGPTFDDLYDVIEA